MESVQLQTPYIQVLNCQVGLSIKEYFDKFLGDDAKHSMADFFISKEAKDVTSSKWKDPDDGDKEY